MAEPYGYWTWNQTKNALAGVEGDPDNPVVLHEDFIVDSLMRSRIAADQFCRLFPTMLPEEQARLLDILERRPRAKHLIRNPQSFYDAVQKRDTTSGIRLSGPRGGRQGDVT